MPKHENSLLFWLALAICLAVWIFNSGCAGKPLAKQEAKTIAQGAKEEFRGVSVENRGIHEELKADSVLVTRFDTVTREKTLIKYYGVKSSKTDTLRITETQTLLRSDTIRITEKTSEKSEGSIFAKIETSLKLLLAITIVIAAAYFFWRARR